MSHYSAERLYALLPAIYRLRDAEQGYPLRDLVALLAREAQVVEADIEGLYRNFFIETADGWVVPYIGDLIGVRPLPAIGGSRRAEVARTIGFRRRKGTAAVLEELAHDITGWPGARVVEYFEQLACTQHLNHLRPHSLGTADLRQVGRVELLDGPFDSLSHTIDVRRIATRRGRHNIRNVGLWLWRLEAYPIIRATALKLSAGNGCHYTVNPLGLDMPLFHLPLTESAVEQIATEIHVPSPIRRRAMREDPTLYTGPRGSFQVFLDGQDEPVDDGNLVVCDLSHWKCQPSNGKVCVDPELGRLAFPAEQSPGNVEVSYAYGFPAAIGGGPYPRVASFTTIAGEHVFRVGREDSDVPEDDHQAQLFATLSEALGALRNPNSLSAVVEIQDSCTYTLEADSISIPADSRLELRAAEGQRPVLLLKKNLTISGKSGSAFEINGLVIAGAGLRASGELNRLTLRHMTLVPLSATDNSLESTPGCKSLVVASTTCETLIEHAIVGPIEAAIDSEMSIRVSIVDAGEKQEALGGSAFGGDLSSTAAGPLTISRCTVVGSVTTRLMRLAENTLFLGPVKVTDCQQGCVRFSFVPHQSRVPRRHRCQPELSRGANPAEEEHLTAAVRPRFSSLTYGNPAYCQLDWRCPQEILRGADDGSEMGAYQSLRTPQREDALRIRLDEYLPVGLEAGIFYAT